ncbi:hypothetical protein [Alteribacillus sp. YIM 98480]|uniref:hypothetical protein n=1 Tax=Alteribacillus sp. YIM 98480 TaxID=2606599 RepID=UPI00131EA032|nr:hypothetical protein [Alteribacillus sp. YIM 98480]
MNQENPIHLPDLLFTTFLSDHFGVNRGVYNTVDEYLYKAGLKDITERRKTVIDFFTYLQRVNGVKANGRINIGRHGLSSRLQEYGEALMQASG